jgi:hypothetical protein
MNKGFKVFLTILSFVAVIAVVVKQCYYHENQHSTMRKNENQIIAYRDSNVVEYYFSNQNGSVPVEIRIEVLLDGYYDVAKETIPAGEIGTESSTINGDPYNYFVAGIYPGRILVFDLDSGKLRERIENLEFRLYDSISDSYDAISSPAPKEREVVLDEEEYRASNYSMRADIKQEELIAYISGLFSEWRSIDSYIYVSVDGKDVLMAKAEEIAPRSIMVEIDLEPGVADILEEGKTYSIHVDSYYNDTKEAYDSIPGVVEVYKAN